MASTATISATTEVNHGMGVVVECTFSLDASGSASFSPQFTLTDETGTVRPYDFTGFASVQIIMTGSTNGTLTVQLYSDNSDTDANYLVGYDPEGVAHPALCTALAFSSTPKKMFENVKIPPCKRHKWTLTEAGGAAGVAGKIYLYLSRVV